jgi:hypothetical protein
LECAVEGVVDVVDVVGVASSDGADELVGAGVSSVASNPEQLDGIAEHLAGSGHAALNTRRRSRYTVQRAIGVLQPVGHDVRRPRLTSISSPVVDSTCM